jgi:hypothetical protein
MKTFQRLGYFVVIPVAIVAGIFTALAATYVRSYYLARQSQQPAFFIVKNGEIIYFAPHEKYPKFNFDLDHNHFALFFNEFKGEVPTLLLPGTNQQPIVLESTVNSEAVGKTRFGFKKGFPRTFTIAFQPEFNSKLQGQIVNLSPNNEQVRRNGVVWRFVYAAKESNQITNPSSIEELLTSIFSLYSWLPPDKQK